MKPWPLLTLFLLMQASAVRGQGAADHLAKGDAALADGLWEIAEVHFRENLADPSLTPEAKAESGIRLAESMVRAGNSAAALELLGQSFLTKHPETPFWKAQALAGQHRFAEACELLGKQLADPASPHLAESCFTRASLLLALDKPEEALEALSVLLAEAEPPVSSRAALNQVEILIDLGRADQARRAMPAKETVAPEDTPLAAFLDAQLLLKEGKFPEAEAAFQELVNQPQGQTTRMSHAVTVGLADALQAAGKTDAAARSLIALVEEHPDSPALDAVFSRLTNWMPAKPTATDPILERITGWITRAPLRATGPVATDSAGAAGAWPEEDLPAATDDRLAHAIFARAMALHRIGTPEASGEATRLLTRLRIEFPGQPLADRALYQQARWLLDSGEVDRALSILDTLRESSGSQDLKGESAFAEARVSYQNNDMAAAVKLFDEAARSLDGNEARIARLQSSIARLRGAATGPSGTKLIQQEATKDPELSADLELERALSATPHAEQRKALAAFLEKHPTHPRVAEARLAAIEAALTGPDQDTAFAQAQLVLLDADPAKTSLPAQRLALARLRSLDLTNDTAGAIAAAQSIIDTWPDDPAAAEASFTLGRNHFQSGSYAPARRVLEKLAASDQDPSRSQAAWLLAARAAALGGTPQSKEEALILFDKAAGIKGPVTAIASLEKARNLVDTNRLPEASAFLKKWIATLPEDDPLQLPAGLLLAEALFPQGSKNPASLLETLAVYDRLLVHAKEHPALLNRLQYLRGITLEQLPDEKDPTKKREKQAFQAYHSVLETTTAPAEWVYFEQCGFKALAMLEKAERWQAAITVAKKIASFNGPRAAEAADRAKELQLEHMPWED